MLHSTRRRAPATLSLYPTSVFGRIYLVHYYISYCIQETATPLHVFFPGDKSAFHRAFRMPLLRQTISASALGIHIIRAC